MGGGPCSVIPGIDDTGPFPSLHDLLARPFFPFSSVGQRRRSLFTRRTNAAMASPNTTPTTLYPKSASSSPLWDMDNVLITPHVAGTTQHYMARALEVFRDNFLSYVSTGELTTPVSVEKGY